MGATLHHVNLKTSRMQAMIDWYGLALGLKPAHVATAGAWLSNDSANHRLALLSFPGMPDDPEKDRHAGYHHMAFEFATLAEWFDNFARLREHGVTPGTCLDHGMTLSMYYVDPDRNVVEIQVDNFQDWRQSSEYMQTSPVFAENPIGVFFDPDRAYAAYAEGRPHGELHRAIMAGEFAPATPPRLVGLPTPTA